MNCSSCNAHLEDGAVFCTQCGAPVQTIPNSELQEPLQEISETQKKPNRKRTKMILIISACILVVACAVLIPVFIEKAKADKYEAAFAMMEKGDAPQAKDDFTELGGYKDSTSLADTCQNMIDYEKANALKEAGDYAAAKGIYDSIKGYEDSAELSQECQKTLDYDAATALKDGLQNKKMPAYIQGPKRWSPELH